MMKNIAGTLIFLTGVLCSVILQAQTFSSQSYTEDVSNIPNPERGFYRHTETQSGAYSYLNAETLRNFRAQGITLILRVFYLSDFVSAPISEQYLAGIQQDFNAARSAGIKVIVRFAYTRDSSPPYGDATPEWVLKHIEQLAPVLQGNGDVIAVVQAGFIGAWGEWYYTDHFSETLGNPTAADWVNRRALVNALLEAVPGNRVVQVRTPAIKFSLIESEDALQEDEAFTLTNRARIGHHNDCFLASSTDFGTYTNNIEEEKQFLEQETKYLPMGGETCGESVPLSECPNALAQMERFHWSYLNRDYHGGVLGSWESGDCLDEVFQKLGYRYRLTKSSLQQASRPGGEVKFNIQIVNDGWANVYNRRAVEMVLRSSLTGKVYKLSVNSDPRKWTMTDTVRLEIEAGLPANIPVGDYEVLLNLPDPERALYDNPLYSIRFANIDTWEEQTGFTSLNHTLIVSKDAEAPTYTGSDFFLSLPPVNDFASVATDGNDNDWQTVPVVGTGVSLSHELKVFNDADSIYFLISGMEAAEAFEVFLDADMITGSGDPVLPWNSNLADYRITNEGISKYSNGAWSLPQPISFYITSEAIEIGVSEDQFTGVQLEAQLQVAAKIITTSEDYYIPAESENFSTYSFLLDPPTELRTTSSGNKVILYWANGNGNENRIIERSLDGATYEKIAVLSSGSFLYIDYLAGNVVADYRSYTRTEDGLSVSNYSMPHTVTTTGRPAYYVFSAEGDPQEWEDVSPLATVSLASRLQAYRIFMSAENLNILFEGDQAEASAFYFDTDNSVSTGASSDPWSYGGFDFVLRNDSLFDIRVGEDFRTKAVRNTSEGFLEMAVPLAEFDNLNDNTVIYTAAIVHTATGMVQFPGTNQSPLKFLRVLPPPVPASVSVSNSENFPETQLIVQWQACQGCKGYIVERAESSDGPFAEVAVKNATTFSHFDSELTKGITYYYRVYSYNDAGVSLASEVVSETPATVTSAEGSVVKAFGVYPNPFQDRIYVESKLAGTSRFELINMQGQVLLSDGLSENQSEKILNLSSLPKGMYVLKFTGRSVYCVRIIKQ